MYFYMFVQESIRQTCCFSMISHVLFFTDTKYGFLKKYRTTMNYNVLSLPLSDRTCIPNTIPKFII